MAAEECLYTKGKPKLPSQADSFMTARTRVILPEIPGAVPPVPPRES